MQFFSGKKHKLPKVIVIGCNRMGAALADGFAAHGYITTIVDKSPESFQKLSAVYRGDTVVGDITEDGAIKELKMKEGDRVFVVTSSDTLNLFIAKMLQGRYGKDLNIISRLNDADKAEVYELFDLKTVCAETIFSEAIVKAASLQMDGDAE